MNKRKKNIKPTGLIVTCDACKKSMPIAEWNGPHLDSEHAGNRDITCSSTDEVKIAAKEELDKMLGATLEADGYKIDLITSNEPNQQNDGTDLPEWGVKGIYKAMIYLEDVIDKRLRYFKEDSEADLNTKKMQVLMLQEEIARVRYWLHRSFESIVIDQGLAEPYLADGHTHSISADMDSEEMAEYDRVKFNGSSDMRAGM